MWHSIMARGNSVGNTTNAGYVGDGIGHKICVNITSKVIFGVESIE